MNKPVRIGMLVVVFFSIVACQNRHGGANDSVSFPDFTAHFQPFTVPFYFTEDSLSSRLPDSTRLIYKEAAAFIPDSLWHSGSKQKTEAKIYPLGKKQYGNLELLMVRIQHGSSVKIKLLVYDKADTLVSVQPLMEKLSGNERSSFELDKNYLLHLNIQKNLTNGEVIKKEDVYGINGDGSVALIMTNTNQPTSPNNFYNPIDTLARKNRYSGDYFTTKSDIVSIRDGEEKGTFRFFIHLNKNKGDCTGEVDGIATFEHGSVGLYKEQDGPCAIRFTFSSTKVTIAEVGGCGAYRGISCNFSGTYTRKKESKPKK